MSKTIALLPGLARPLLEPQLPDWIEARWFFSREQAISLAPGAEICWLDMNSKPAMFEAIQAATDVKWLNSIYAGVDGIPLEALAARGAVMTNGVGINAVTIAEYVVMGMLTMAKGFRDVVRAQEKHQWLEDSPGKIEIAESRALILGYGAIGALIGRRLEAFDCAVTSVRRSGDGRTSLGPSEWRARLGEFDWIILAVPATPETEGLFGEAELAAMKPSAYLINIARGSVVDQDALVSALERKAIAGAFLDVTTPEPLPPEHPLWSLDNAHITMHLSGRAQDKMLLRSAKRFLENLQRYGKGEPLSPSVDLKLGY